MYCTQLSVYGNRVYPLLVGAIYEAVCLDYNLPSVDLLMRSLKNDVVWPTGDNNLQVYYLDNLQENNRKDLFQIRFATSRDARELVSVFLSVEESRVVNMTVHFPGRTGRGCFSRILAAMKSAAHQLGLNAREIQFEVQGFPEAGLSTYIREQSLTAFVWVEGLGRYVHVKEDPSKFTDVRRGYRNL